MADNDSSWGWIVAAITGMLGVAGAVAAYNCGHSDGYEEGIGEQNEAYKQKYAELRDSITNVRDQNLDHAIKKLQRIMSSYLELLKWAYDNNGITKEDFDCYRNMAEADLDSASRERINGIREKISECIDGLRVDRGAIASDSRNPKPVPTEDDWWDRMNCAEEKEVSFVDIIMKSVMQMGATRI